LRTDSNGILRWGKLYSTDTTGNKFRGRGIPMPDSTYVIIGKGGDYFSYIKIDTAGNVLISYRMQGWWNPGDGVLGAVCLLPDNSVMVGGRSDFDPYLMKLDPQGNVVWIKTYTSTTINTDVLFNLMTASDGTIYATGTRDAPINVSSLGQLFQFDTSGNVLQAAACIDNSIVPASLSISMLGNADEVFALENSPAQGVSPRLYKIGNVLGAGCYMQSITTMVTSHTPLPQQPVIYTRNDGWAVSRDFSLTPFTLTATLLCNATSINEPAASETSMLFPNPVQPGGVVTFTAANTTAWHITDAAGRTVLKGQTAGGTVEISLSELSSGVYVFTSFNENGQLEIRQKLIKAF
jgi:outer membrane protein assembly factor BamB